MNYHLIPEATLEALEEYVIQGQPVGSFLEAVLRHDLFDAVGRADLHSQRALVPLVSLIYNHCPSSCHGMGQQVDVWLEQGGIIRHPNTGEALRAAGEEWRQRFQETIWGPTT